MKNRLSQLLACAVLAAALSGCAGDATRPSTGEFIDDSVITTRVKSALLADPATSALRINVETFRGTVQLSGFAKSKEEADKAVEIARRTPGVRTVSNDIRVR